MKAFFYQKGDGRWFVVLALGVLSFFWTWFVYGPQFMDDALSYGWPTRSIIIEHFARFEFPRWDPYSYGGDTWLGSPIYGIFYLPQLLMVPVVWIFGKPMGAWPYASWIIGHFMVAGFGAWYLGRRLGFERTWCLLMAWGYALNQLIIKRHRHECYLIPIVWLPWLCLIMLYLMEKPSWKRVVVLGLSTGAVLVSTTPQYYFFVGMALLGLACWMPLQENVSRKWVLLQLMTSMVIALGIIAIPLYYQAEYAKYCGRLDRVFLLVEKTSSPWWEIGRVFLPYFSGKYPLSEGPWIGWGESFEFPVIRFLEEANFTGLVILFGVMLFISQRGWRDKTMRPWLFLALFGMAFALGQFNPLRIALRWLIFPMATARNPIRSWCLVELAMVVLSAVGWRHYFSAGVSLKKSFMALALLVGCILASMGLSHWRMNVVPPLPDLVSTARKIVREGFFVHACTLILIVWLLWIGAKWFKAKGWKGMIAPLGLCLLLFSELTYFGSRLVLGTPNSVRIFDLSDPLRQLRDILKRDQMRFDGHPIFDISFYPARNRMPSLQGYSTLRMPNTGERFVRPDGKPQGNFDRRMDLYGVAYSLLIDDQGLSAIPRENPFPKAWFCPKAIPVDQKNVMTMIDDPKVDLKSTVLIQSQSAYDAHMILQANPRVPSSGSVSVKQYLDSDVRIESHSSGPGWVVINDHALPGWNCTIDGKRVPIFRADGIFRAVWVDGGNHDIHYWFWPWKMTYGLIIGGVTLFFCGILWWMEGKIARGHASSGD